MRTVYYEYQVSSFKTVDIPIIFIQLAFSVINCSHIIVMLS